MSTSTAIHESSINFIAEQTRIEGKIVVSQISRIHGVLAGELLAKDGSTVILSETAVIEGNIQADTLVVDGYVRGDIAARTRVVISRTGRVIGNITTPSLNLEFGSFFEGRCRMENLPPTP